MEQENPISDHSFQEADIEQPSQTFPLTNLSQNHCNNTMINSDIFFRAEITQFLKNCEFQKALDYLELQLSAQEKQFGEHSIHIVPLLNLVAEMNLALANFSIVSDLSQRSEQILATHQEDPITRPLLAHAYQNLAVVHQENLEYKEALEMINKAQAIYLELSHQDNFESYCVKVTILSELKRYKEAFEAIQKSLEIIEKSIDKIDQYLAARVYNTLGYLNRIVNKMDEARKAHQKALEICQKFGYNDHVEEANAQVGIGWTLTGEEVLDYANLAMEIYEKCFEKAHPGKISALLLLAKYSDERKRKKDKAKYTKLIMEKSQEVYGPESARTRAVYIETAILVADKKTAECLLKQIAKISREKMSEKELGLLSIQTCEASSLYGNLLKENISEALMINTKLHGRVSMEVAKLYAMLAGLYLNGGRKSQREVIKWFLESLEIYREVLGDDHIENATRYLFLAKCFYTQKDCKKAIIYCENSLKIRRDFYGDIHPLTVENYIFFANAYSETKEYKKSIQAHRKVLEAHQKTNVEMVYDTFESIGMVYLKVSDRKNAEVYFRKAYQMARVKLGPNDEKTVDTREFSEFGDEERCMLEKNDSLF